MQDDPSRALGRQFFSLSFPDHSWRVAYPQSFSEIAPFQSADGCGTASASVHFPPQTAVHCARSIQHLAPALHCSGATGAFLSGRVSNGRTNDPILTTNHRLHFFTTRRLRSMICWASCSTLAAHKPLLLLLSSFLSLLVLEFIFCDYIQQNSSRSHR